LQSVALLLLFFNEVIHIFADGFPGVKKILLDEDSEIFKQKGTNQ
jgi:hypothetical protein